MMAKWVNNMNKQNVLLRSTKSYEPSVRNEVNEKGGLVGNYEGII